MLEGASSLIAQLRKLAEKHENVLATVGFSAAYALVVHEDMEAHHKTGQAKFLEEPARSIDHGAIIRGEMQKGRTMKQAVLIAALNLQREAQLRCPVRTGVLRASAFTEVKDG